MSWDLTQVGVAARGRVLQAEGTASTTALRSGNLDEFKEQKETNNSS